MIIREAKMDIDTRALGLTGRVQRYLLDMRLYHQNPRYRGQLSLAQEQSKFARYVVHHKGRRVVDATLVPVVVSNTGALGPTARGFLEGLERASKGVPAQGSQRRYARSSNVSLCDRVSLLGVYLAAELQVRA